jgi:hypothetical protein
MAGNVLRGLDNLKRLELAKNSCIDGRYHTKSEIIEAQQKLDKNCVLNETKSSSNIVVIIVSVCVVIVACIAVAAALFLYRKLKLKRSSKSALNVDKTTQAASATATQVASPAASPIARPTVSRIAWS